MNDEKNKIFNNSFFRILYISCISILFLGLVLNFSIIYTACINFLSIISPFIVAVGLAYLLNRPMLYLEKTILKKIKNKKIKRGISILILYMIIFVLTIAMLSIVIPQLTDSVTTLWSKAQSFYNNANEEIPKLFQQYHIDPNIADHFVDLLKDFMNVVSQTIPVIATGVLNASYNIGNWIIQAFMCLFAIVYMLNTKDVLHKQTKGILYAFFSKKNADLICNIGRHSNKVFSDFIVGKILDSAIIGVLCFVGMCFIHKPYALLISLIIGITNVIPFFGPFIGAIPSIFILLIVDPIDALFFAGFVLVLQQFDGNFLGPRILGDSTGLSPLWVLVSITIGGGLFGFVGMLIGVPTFSVIYTLVKSVIAIKLERKGIDSNGNTVKENN